MKNYYIGIDLGGTNIKLGLINQKGIVEKKEEYPTPKTYLETLQGLEAMIEGTGIPKDFIIGVGIGIPGFIDMEYGFVREAVNIGWRNVNLKSDLEEKLKLPVSVDNDANLAALGELWKGAGFGSKHIVCITIGTGVGSGIVVDGKLLHGKKGMAGEIGHLPINPQSNNLCNCGKKGCLETEVSATAMVLYLKDSIASGRTSVLSALSTTKDIFDAAKQGDRLAIEIVDRAANYLGLAIAQIASVTAPEKIIIGGGVSKAGKLLLDPLSKYFRAYSTPEIEAQTEVVLAKLENNAGIIGAAFLAKMSHPNTLM